MLRLRHPNVINTVQVPAELSAPLDELPYLGMEYCIGGDLRRVSWKPLTAKQAHYVKYSDF